MPGANHTPKLLEPFVRLEFLQPRIVQLRLGERNISPDASDELPNAPGEPHLWPQVSHSNHAQTLPVEVVGEPIT